jgi:hypothetical protein
MVVLFIILTEIAHYPALFGNSAFWGCNSIWLASIDEQDD